MSIKQQSSYSGRYPTFEALLAAEDLAAIAPDLAGREALLAACRAIYPAEKEALGVIALEISPGNRSEGIRNRVFC